MDKMNNVRTKQIEANFEHFNVSPSRVSDTAWVFLKK